MQTRLLGRGGSELFGKLHPEVKLAAGEGGHGSNTPVINTRYDNRNLSSYYRSLIILF
jgi:hypothetical protein